MTWGRVRSEEEMGAEELGRGMEEQGKAEDRLRMS